MRSFLWPSTVVIIDDNKGFLKSLANCFIGENYNVILFSNPVKALDYINTMKHNNQYITSISEDSFTKFSFTVDFFELNKLMSDINRFKSLSLVISDFDMPEMTGEELFRNINCQNIQKMMLTGAMDLRHALAIKGNLINDYQEKSSLYFIDDLKTKINRLIENYFNKLCVSMELFLAQNSNHLFNFNDFKIFFINLIIKMNIIEYYLLEYSGNYLLIDKNKKSYLLLCQTKEQMQAAINDFYGKNEIYIKLKSFKYQIGKLENHRIVLPEHNIENYIYPVDIVIDNLWYISLIPTENVNIKHWDYQNIELRTD